MFGFDEPRYIFKADWNVVTYQKLLANFAKRVLASDQTLGLRVKTAADSMPTDAELTNVTNEFGKDSSNATWTLANLQIAGWSDLQICGRYEFALFIKTADNIADATYTAPKFYADYSGETTGGTAPEQILAGQ